jgi:hypothetical protein
MSEKCIIHPIHPKENDAFATLLELSADVLRRKAVGQRQLSAKMALTEINRSVECAKTELSRLEHESNNHEVYL